MPYRHAKRVGTRGRCIDISEDWKLVYWSSRLGVSRVALRRAIDRVGAKARDVERELHASRRS
jgi:hypothetical protein